MFRDSSIGLTASKLGRTTQWLRGIARSLTADSQIADDLVQNTFVAALSPARAPVNTLRPWLNGVLMNLHRMWARTRVRSLARDARELPSTDAGAPATSERAWEVVRLRDALAHLAEPYRTILKLRYVDELTPAEIHARWRIPASTLRRQTAIGLSLLRARFGIDPSRPA
jgi:RNA polymerase sigma factor (sigma-70 family)